MESGIFPMSLIWGLSFGGRSELRIDMNRVLAAIAVVCFGAGGALAQSMGRLIAEPWGGNVCYVSYDQPIVEAGGHVKEDSSDTDVFSWDSFGRIRFDENDQKSVFVAYHLLTMGLGTDTPLFKAHMDEMNGLLGFHVGEVAGWDVGVAAGGGYSSTWPFVNSNGIFQIGHLTAEKPIDAHNSFLVAVDYEGNGSLLPDVPLPGFAFLHREKDMLLMVGYPTSKLKWKPSKHFQMTANYDVPYSADVDLDYRVDDHYGFFCNAGNFFHGFVRDDMDLDHRQFFQMTRFEMGVRCNFDPYWDGTIGIGFACNQNISNGYDIRDMRPVGHLTNEPYLGFILRGGF